jgi:hypothetical protein
MRFDGWIFMIISWSVILALFTFSMVRTVSGKGKGRNKLKE